MILNLIKLVGKSETNLCYKNFLYADKRRTFGLILDGKRSKIRYPNKLEGV